MEKNTNFDNIHALYKDLKTEWEKIKPEWDDISHFVGISVDTDFIRNKGNVSTPRQLDDYIDDPTASLSVNQAGDYLMGIMWGTGDKVLDIIPSRYVTQIADEAELKDWYDFATDQTLYHMNHADAGFTTSLRPYTYDQFSFGTSGLGVFKNKAFKDGIDENALIFRSYGVDNTMISEGKSGLPDTVACVYNWTISRIIGEFVMNNGVFDQQKFDRLPNILKQAYTAKDFTKKFQLVNMVYPREDFDPKFKGKRGTRYKGVWFMEDGSDRKIFYEEDFAERPISVARAIKVRGRTYGHASGTMLISTIRSVNFMVGTSIEIIEKMSNPSLGMLNNAIFGDSVLDTSPDGITIFNSALTQASKNPVFPLYDVGDPSKILQFLVPYLNEKIVTAFKVDSLLDFSSAKEMTATESLQRYAIRGKSLAGFLLQQKNEGLVPTSKRSISLLMSMGELGINPRQQGALAQQLMSSGRGERVIPDAVLRVMESGRPWYELRFNNELEQLTRTETIQNLIQIIQAITAIAGLYPQIIEAVEWYELLKDINDNLDYNTKILISADEFKEKIAAAAQQQQQMMMMQAGQVAAGAQKDMAQANKSNAEAKKTG